MFDWYNDLPKETRMMVALAGLGTPMGVIWLLKRYAYPDAPTLWIILGVAAGVAVLALLIVVLKKFMDESP